MRRLVFGLVLLALLLGAVPALQAAPLEDARRRDRELKGERGRTHLGTDVMAPHGARVFAFTGGVVSRESTSANGGIQLYLQGDNGVEYFYAHLSGYAVPTGARVRTGQLIAYNGQTGNASYTAPHVHFEVHLGGSGGTPVNPYPYLKRVCG